MLSKVFFLGRPGSGKSTAARHMIELAERRNYSTRYMRDYDILYQMFREDSGKQFKPADYNGFDVLDMNVFDTALKRLEENILAIQASEKKQLVVIEFARDNYHDALKLFEPGFLQDSSLFFVDADLQVCMQRIHKRVRTPSEPDHHYVSDYIMQTYYYRENWMYVSSHLKDEFPFFKYVESVRNTKSLPDLLAYVSNFADMVFQNEVTQEEQEEGQNISTQNCNGPSLLKGHLIDFPHTNASFTPLPSSASVYTQYTDERQNDPVVLAP